MLNYPLPVTRALRKLEHDIRDARRRWRLPLAIVMQRASISKPTLIKIERGKSDCLDYHAVLMQANYVVQIQAHLAKYLKIIRQ
jgi:hypothetical protein